MHSVIQGDCRDVMRTLIADGVRVQCVVTSPPYWGLRDYGTAQWEGGDSSCNHIGSVERTAPPGTDKQASNRGAGSDRSGDCACGAVRIDRQLGLESTYQEYVANMVEVFGLVRELLADDGVLWLNLGDSYATGAGAVGNCPGGGVQGEKWQGAMTSPNRMPQPGLKPKDLCGIPWRVAFALQEAGWWLRQDIIWSKPNPMPESVRDRCTKAHEYVFLLTKSERYYYDAEAIQEPASHAGGYAGYAGYAARAQAMGRAPSGNEKPGAVVMNAENRNRRSVWHIATQPYPEAHFATMPEALVEPCILAGSRAGDTIFDPFMGSGTVASVAQRLGRKWLGAELNPKYIELIHERTKGTLGMEFA